VRFQIPTCRGGSVELHVVAGLWHCWPVWGEFPEVGAASDTIADFMQRHTSAAGSNSNTGSA
jgi:hypothetical protein